MYVSAEVTDIWDHARESFNPEVLHAWDLPAPISFALMPRPMIVTDIDGNEDRLPSASVGFRLAVAMSSGLRNTRPMVSGTHYGQVSMTGTTSTVTSWKRRSVRRGKRSDTGRSCSPATCHSVRLRTTKGWSPIILTRRRKSSSGVGHGCCYSRSGVCLVRSCRPRNRCQEHCGGIASVTTAPRT